MGGGPHPLRDPSVPTGLAAPRDLLALLTHPLLDCFTVYGTQVLLPFSDLPVAWSTVFIIDPAFSVPVALGVLAALVLSRERGLGHRLNHAGLALGVAWLAFTVVAKAHVDRVARDSLPPGVTGLFTTPTPMNAVLWRVVAMTGDGRYLEGYYSLLDTEPRVSFTSRPDGHELLEPLRNEAAVARLVWFSRGFFSGREISGAARSRSPTFGWDWRSGSCSRSWWAAARGDVIEPAPVRQRPGPEVPPGMWAALGERILGRSAEPACIVSC